MNELLKVADLKAELESLPDDLPVFMFDLHTDEAYPLQRVDPTISDRIDLNFSSEEQKLYRAHVAVYHSFTVLAPNEEEAHRIASEDVNWDDHVTGCSLDIEEENADDVE
jgi:hypothetical protein